jgi:hypothetical protein
MRGVVCGGSGGFLFSLSALGAAKLFAGQFLVKGLATIDADLAAFIFSAHTYDCGEPRLHLAKVHRLPAYVTPVRPYVTHFSSNVTLFRLHVTLPVTPSIASCCHGVVALVAKPPEL